MDQRHLRIIYWNANGMSPEKTRLLKLLLDQRQADVALINETHLKPVDKLKMAGFYVYREDHISPSGIAYRGLAILVRRRIVHQLLPVPTLRASYALGVEICINQQPTRVFAFYRPPHYRLAVSDVHTLLDSPLPTIIAGDFNLKHTAWNANTNTREGSRLLDDAELHNYVVLGPEAPTHYPGHRQLMPDVIDLAVLRGITATVSCDVLDDHLRSDHQPVSLTIEDIPQRLRPLPSRPRRDWRTFAAHMAQNSPSYRVDTPADVDRLAADFTTATQAALAEAQLSNVSTPRRPAPLPAAILAMIERKRRLRRQWQRTRCPTMKNVLNALAARISSAVANHAAESWQRAIEHASDDWSGLHRLCRNLSGKPAPIRPLLAGDNTPRYRAEDRAELFADSLERQFQPNPARNVQHTAAVELQVAQYLEQPISPEEDPVVLSPGLVRRMALRAPLRKAPGPDGIPNEALRRLPPRGIATLTRLFNGILRTGHFPSKWKLGRVIMLPKQGKNTLLPGSYRPITLLDTVSKLFEKLLLLHLRPHLQPRVEQFGFRAEHSTTLQVARVLHDLAAARNKRERAAAVFLDMERAFDRVWHAGLLSKLATSTTPRRLVKIVATFLHGRTFQVAVEGALSTERTIRAGVPQGSCISPVCYCVYTDDIPVVDGVKLALYADDAAYYTTSLNPRHAVVKLQRALDALPEWLEKWRLAVNVAKTQALAVGIMKPTPMTLMGEQVQWAPSVKYLGVKIDRSLSMTPHVLQAAAQARAARHLLRPVLNSALPLRAKLGIYKAYIRTRLTYAAPAWYALVSESNKKRLRAQQSLTLRTIVNAPRFVRNATIARDLGVESIDAFVQRLSTSMFDRSDRSRHDHLRELAPYHRRPPDGLGLPRDLVAPTDPSDAA